MKALYVRNRLLFLFLLYIFDDIPWQLKMNWSCDRNAGASSVTVELAATSRCGTAALETV